MWPGPRAHRYPHGEPRWHLCPPFCSTGTWWGGGHFGRGSQVCLGGWGLVYGDSESGQEALGGWERLHRPQQAGCPGNWVLHWGFRACELLPALPPQLCFLPPPGREGQGPLEILQLDFEMENFTSQSVKRRIMWHIDYRGQGALPDLERAVTELTVIQRDVQAILPLAMVSRAGDRASGCTSLSWVHA